MGNGSQLKTVAKGGKSGNVELARDEVVHYVLSLGLRDRPVKLDQNLTGRNLIAILNMDSRDNSSLKRLDGLGAPRWDNLAGCSRNDVDAAEYRPYDGNREKQDDYGADCPPHR